MADTDILLTVGFDARDADKTAEQLQKEIEDIFNSRKGQQSASLTSLETQMKKVYNRASELRKQLEEVGGQDAMSERYAELGQSLDKYETKYYELVQKMSQFEEAGGDIQSQKYQQWLVQFEQIENTLAGIHARREQMEKDGTAFIKGTETAEYKRLQTELDGVNDRLKQQIIRYNEIQNKGTTSIKSTTREMNRLGNAAEKVRRSSKGVSSNFNKGILGATKNIKGLLVKFGVLFLGVRGLYSVIMKIRSAILEGFKNLRESGVGRLKEQMNDLTNACTTLKNALAGAFEPIVTAVIPYIQRLIEWLTAAIDKLAQFIAAMRGQTTYIKAIKQVGDASKKANQELSKLDNLNVLTSQKNGAEGMFEEAQIADEMVDRVTELKKKIEEIKRWLDQFIFNPVKDFLKWLISPITDNIDKIKLAFHNLMVVLQPIFDGIKKSIEHTFGVIKQVYDEYIAPTLNKLRDKVSEFIGHILDFWNAHADEFKWIAEQIAAIWEESVQPVIDAALELFGSLFALIIEFVTGGDLDALFAGLEYVWNWLYPKFKQFLSNVRIGAKVVSEKLTEFLGNVRRGADTIRALLDKTGSKWTTFKIIVRAVVDSIVEKFYQLKDDIYTITHYGQEEFGILIYMFKSPLVVAIDLAKRAFKKLVDTVQKLVDLIKELTGFDLASDLSPLRQIVDKIDWDALKHVRNSFLSGATGIMGGFSFGGGMASGGVIPPNVSEHLVMVGDNNHETEVISPLSTMQEAMINALQSVGFGGTQEIVLNLDGREFMRAMVKQNNEYKKSHGGLSAMA